VALGAHFTIAAPGGYGFTHQAISSLELSIGMQINSSDLLAQTTDPIEAVRGCDVVYTDAWTSMGQESERDARIKDFRGYQVTENLFDQAQQNAILMHPMPAHYGEEIPKGMLDHPRSVAYRQAGNRLHAQKAVISYLMSSDISEKREVTRT
jgi:ornithine carbamoyltransferase